ncbi:hypothetical protein ACFCYM_01205 [Streptomyces sp. NPDC056254]|uniref:hypothetical protein n=1 Tax=Streptomyces sp. NPDC056254 TaxID=3345763 RepID=UPI0035DAFD0C
MYESSWIGGAVVAAVAVTPLGSGIGLLATSMAAPTPATAPRPAVLVLPLDPAGAVHTGYATVSAPKPHAEEPGPGHPSLGSGPGG